MGALSSGSTALASHGVKAGLRILINTMPEPFSNIAVSLTEDGLVATVVGFSINYPLPAFAIAATLLAGRDHRPRPPLQAAARGDPADARERPSGLRALVSRRNSSAEEREILRLGRWIAVGSVVGPDGRAGGHRRRPGRRSTPASSRSPSARRPPATASAAGCSSAKPACRRRKVVIFRKRSGADDRIRATRSRRGGAWEAIPPHRRAGAGRYYAVIRTKLSSGGGSACAAVTTSDVVVSRH